MNDKEIIEGNKLIAEFENLWEAEEGYLYYPRLEKGFKIEQLEYNSSWDWLMPVVEKIEELYDGYGFTVEIRSNQCLVHMNTQFSLAYPELAESYYTIEIRNGSKKIATWLAVIEFVKWYNQQNNNQ